MYPLCAEVDVWEPNLFVTELRGQLVNGDTKQYTIKHYRMEHRDRIDFTALIFLFTSEIRNWLNKLGWEGASQSRCN